MDGVSAMDTGNNGQMLSMNVESIGEVKILTQGYQAEYGRSSGLQITAVTKSGTNQFRGSAYDIQTNSDWNANTWVNEKNGDPKPKSDDARRSATPSAGRSASRAATTSCSSSTRHEYRPVDGGDQRRQPDPHPRADGARARRRLLADARQQRRALQPASTIRARRCPCTAGQHGRLLPGRRRPRHGFPPSSLYGPGLAVLNRYPLPNVTQGAGLELQL